MSEIILKIENLSKQYRLGTIGTGTLSHDLNRWWYQIRGKEDPYLKVGELNDRAVKSESDYVWALKDINLEVKKGEVLGIIGKNGAGKSTLLKILSKVTGPTTGSIKSKGRIASLLEVGTGFHPELTGKENIFLNGAILGMTKAEINSKYDAIVEFSGCERYIDTPVKRYSSGMRVRLAFAVAAFLEPDILVVDEVLAVGDAEFQKKAIGKMQDISKGEGRTVLFVSHNMAAVRNLCSRCIILEKGKVRLIGEVEESINLYLSRADNLKTLSLSERNDRLGNNNLFKFINFKIVNQFGNDVESIISGDYCAFIVDFKSEIMDLENMMVTVGIRDSNNDLVNFWAFDELGFKLKRGSSNFKLVIPKLMLRGGSYAIWLFSSYLSTSPNNFCDVIENVYNLQVLPSDYWKSGKINRTNAIALIDGEFK